MELATLVSRAVKANGPCAHEADQELTVNSLLQTWRTLPLNGCLPLFSQVRMMRCNPHPWWLVAQAKPENKAT